MMSYYLFMFTIIRQNKFGVITHEASSDMLSL